MGKKQLILTFLLGLLLSIPALVHAMVGIPGMHHGKHKDANQSSVINQSAVDQNSTYRAGYDQGYPRGFDQGRSDHGAGLKYDFDDNADYKDPDDIGWTSAMGNKREFEKGFRSGFELGYQDGYSGKEPQIATAPPLPEVEQQPQAAETVPLIQRPSEIQEPSELARTEEPTESPYRMGWDEGYKRGFEGGQNDHTSGAKFDEDDAPGFKDGHSFCEPIEHKGEHQCRKQYRKGFKQGYADGYSGLVSRLLTPQVPAQSQAAATATEIPGQAETQNQQPSTAMQETSPSQPSTAMQETQPSPSTTIAKNQPRALPKTASDLSVLGLIGILGIALSLMLRMFRRITGKCDA